MNNKQTIIIIFLLLSLKPGFGAFYMISPVNRPGQLSILELVGLHRAES